MDLSRTIIFLAIFTLSACSTIESNSRQGILGSGKVEQVENKPQSLLRVADSLFDDEDYVASYMMYYNAWELNDGADARLDNLSKMGQASSQLRLSQFKLATIIYAELLKSGYSSPQLQLGMAESYFGMGRIKEAQVLMQSLSDDEFTSAHYYTLKGVLFELALKHQEARLNYEKAMALQPNKSTNVVNLALSYALTENFDTSFALLNSIEADEEQIALVYALKGDIAMAEKIITQFLFRKGMGRGEVDQNLNFYKKLADLPPSERVKAVVYGVIDAQ
jgi:tetratricopeptide (TPR) repeat protein